MRPKLDIKWTAGALTRLPMATTYLYLSLPIFIFFFGWLSLPIAIAMALILAAGLVLAIRGAPRISLPRIKKSDLPRIIFMIVVAFLWVYLSGIGKFAYQNYDHMWRNATLELLVSEEWPVVLSRIEGCVVSDVALTYYFATWLPAACFGKLFGLGAAHTFLYFWCTVGVLLAFTLLVGLTRRLSVWVVLGFVFFSGLDIVGDFMLNNHAGYIWLSSIHIENWAHGFQMSSISTQLFWVYNQAIPAWLITLALLGQKNNRSIFLIYSFAFLSCTLPAIGLIPIAVYVGIKGILSRFRRGEPLAKNAKAILVDTFTLQNVIAGGAVTAVTLLFIRSNATGGSGFGLAEISSLRMSYLIFVLLEFLVYYLAIFKYQKRNPLFYVSLATLLAVPLVVFGPHVDFVMRASIPSLVVLFILTANTLSKCKRTNDRARALIIIALLVLGGVTAYHEIIRSVTATIAAAYDQTVELVPKRIELLTDGMRDNFFGDISESIFFKYLAKQ